MLELLINANITKFHVQICRTTREIHSAPLPPTIQVLVSKMSKHIQLLSAAGATFVFIKSSPKKLPTCRFHITHFLPGAWVYDLTFMQAAVQRTDRITPIFGLANQGLKDRPSHGLNARGAKPRTRSKLMSFVQAALR